MTRPPRHVGKVLTCDIERAGRSKENAALRRLLNSTPMIVDRACETQPVHTKVSTGDIQKEALFSDALFIVCTPIFRRLPVDLTSYGERVEGNFACAGAARGRANILGKGDSR